MAGRTLDISEYIGIPDGLPSYISNQFTRWNQMRIGWIEEKKELRNYVFATDTTKTTNSNLPWKNSTTIPKLCQIRDNLHANYMAALFPNDDWLIWEGDDEDAEAEAKRKVILSYMQNKLRNSGFINAVSELVYDFIDFGNVLGSTEYVNEVREDITTGEVIPGYVGPRAVRVTPYDVTFNPVAAHFENSPKIIRFIKTLGEIAADMEDHPEMGYLQEVFDKVTSIRKSVAGMTSNDLHEAEGLQVDGFGSMLEYYQSGYVEILEFYGDIWDGESETLLKNHIITVVDRMHVIRKIPNPSWRGQSLRHAGWRLRPGNLWAMGPLDNLVGMQYRIDHLENLKADVFDMIAYPMLKISGHVETFEYQPGEEIFVGEEGDVQFMHPDTTALQADMQIERLEAKMEDMVGAPKQAMGIRTPGEKTKFEVQTLDNASSRIFQSKITYFERNFLEPLLNDMLELARRNMEISDVVRVVDDEFGAALFETITPEDLASRGKLRPMGARHFAAKANQFQNLNNLANSAMYNDPAVNTHFSGLKLAQVVEELLDIEKFDLVSPNVRVAEQLETQRMIDTGSQELNDERAAEGGQPPEEEEI
tara:strand:- start:6327 stop:8102 length:1776 start_codon:yes stop_codon:yes gene_type:complete